MHCREKYCDSLVLHTNACKQAWLADLPVFIDFSEIPWCVLWMGAVEPRPCYRWVLDSFALGSSFNWHLSAEQQMRRPVHARDRGPSRHWRGRMKFFGMSIFLRLDGALWSVDHGGQHDMIIAGRLALAAIYRVGHMATCTTPLPLAARAFVGPRCRRLAAPWV